MKFRSEQFKTTLVCLLLAAATLALFLPASRFGFINLDDPDYLRNNDPVRRGLSWSSVAWAFTTFHAANWHPVTWLSHMLDCQLFGLNPGWHHLTNILFHTANSVLLFLVLRSMTGGFWNSALVAGLFAWHPLHVESVAWISERKDVLSAFFFLLTLWTYARFTGFKVPGSKFKVQSWKWYGLALLCSALGLMSKPMLVTLPFVLFLLDYWPLQRFQFSTLSSQASTIRRLIWEKLPFAALSAASTAITFFAQHKGGAVSKWDNLPLMWRLENAFVSCTRYLQKTFWPEGLAAYYPHPGTWGGWVWGGALAGLALITLLVLWQGRSRPYLVVGWLWYGITLLPVIGLIQVGTQAMADRYMYIPSIGVFVLVVWGLADLSARWRVSRLVLCGAAGLVLGALWTVARAQLNHWKDGSTLFQHALTVTGESALAHWNLGCFFADQERWDEAATQFAVSLSLDPDNANVYALMGRTLLATPRQSEAEAYFRESLSRKPSADAHYGLGLCLERQGQLDQATSHYRLALQLQPDYAMAHYSLANRLAAQANSEGALSHYRAALRSQPDYAEAHNNLANLLAGRGLFGQAAYHYEAALRANSNYVDAINNLAWFRATCPDAGVRKGAEAVRQAERAVKLSREMNLQRSTAAALDTLAAAYAEAGQLANAVRGVQEAIALARATGDTNGAAQMEERLKLYQAGQPYREP